jgi:integrase
MSVLDAAGRRRSPATMPGYHAGRPPRNKGIRYPADPPTVDEIVAVMRHTANDRHGWRLRAMIVVLWRAGLRVHEALALTEHDLDQRRGSILVRRGKGGEIDRYDLVERWFPVRTDCRVTTPSGETRVEKGSSEVFIAMFALVLVVGLAFLSGIALAARAVAVVAAGAAAFLAIFIL